MPRWRYDTGFDPPAPVVDLLVRATEGSEGAERVRALLDTGADACVMPEAIVALLALQPVGSALVEGETGSVERRPLYTAVLEVEGLPRVLVHVVPGREDYALVGRDLLNRWRVLLDGPGQEVEVAAG